VNEVGSMTAVPLSIEYPIETAASPAQVFVLALSVKGDVTTAPFVGVETVMAWVDAVQPTSANATNSNLFMGDFLVVRRRTTEKTAGEVHCRRF